jgi:hypothetical protein
MADVTIYGVPQSTFTRTCCMTCEEKGIGYERLDAAPHSAEILDYNPTGSGRAVWSRKQASCFQTGSMHITRPMSRSRVLGSRQVRLSRSPS